MCGGAAERGAERGALVAPAHPILAAASGGMKGRGLKPLLAWPQRQWGPLEGARGPRLPRRCHERVLLLHRCGSLMLKGMGQGTWRHWAQSCSPCPRVRPPALSPVRLHQL